MGDRAFICELFAEPGESAFEERDDDDLGLFIVLDAFDEFDVLDVFDIARFVPLLPGGLKNVTPPFEDEPSKS